MATHSFTLKYQNSSSSRTKCLSYIDMTPWIELGCTPDFDQGIKLSGKVPFVTFEQLGKELPSDKARTDYRNIIFAWYIAIQHEKLTNFD